MNPKLKVGGPACTGGCARHTSSGSSATAAKHKVPLDFFSWHSYGGRDEFNPYQFSGMPGAVRRALDAAGFKTCRKHPHANGTPASSNAYFSDTPAGAAFYASTLMCLLDAGVDRAFQYCGDNHPMLGLHGLDTGEPKICAFAFAAWKQMLETPERLAATGSDERGYNVLAGKSSDNAACAC